MLPDVAAAAREIAAARELGVKVALDDFGTGHSSLTLLRSLTIDRVKIDRTFIRDFTSEPARRRDRPAGHRPRAATSGLDVVAEGVETPEQARLLLELGCPRAQGWLWAKALPIAELRARLDAQRRDRRARARPRERDRGVAFARAPARRMTLTRTSDWTRRAGTRSSRSTGTPAPSSASTSRILASRWHDEFDAWADAYVNPFADLLAPDRVPQLGQRAPA